MRGTQGYPRIFPLLRGIIPAYAGNTMSSDLTLKNLRDHPRVCGEHNSEGYQRSRRQGSSPRMRGTHDNGDMVHAAPGIIPAYAGNTADSRRHCPWRWDHPRVCGEHRHRRVSIGGNPGSSPRMRGTLRALLAADRFRGIIPAYAGNTIRAVRTSVRTWDHPRVCGEHYNRSMDILDTTGSSPRMRGTPAGSTIIIIQPGIIPAYAGNTRPAHGTCRDLWDHPRVCGEHCLHTNSSRNCRGSSPRMRGTREFHRSGRQGVGIIPAYAGNTQCFAEYARKGGDHPRVCGEH